MMLWVLFTLLVVIICFLLMLGWQILLIRAQAQIDHHIAMATQSGQAATLKEAEETYKLIKGIIDATTKKIGEGDVVIDIKRR